MTTRQFWMKMDQLCDTKKLSSDQKEEKMAALLKTAYEDNLNILAVCNETEEGEAHQMYVPLDPDNLFTVGNRFLVCYTGKKRAIYDTHAPTYPVTSLILEIPVRDVLNNLFNKRVIGGLVFNYYLDYQAIIVRKEVLERYIQGEKPLPPNFVDTPMPYPLEYPKGMEPQHAAHSQKQEATSKTLKKWDELTPEDKEKFYRNTVDDYNKRYNGLPWSEIERRMRLFLDQAFDDKKFPLMSPDGQIDAAFCRKEFGNKKPSLVDYMLWTGRFVTHSDYVEI